MVTSNSSHFYELIAKQVAASVAPTWPLDRSVAVNPWWQRRHENIGNVFAEQYVLTGESGLMDQSYFNNAWQSSVIRSEHLEQADSELGTNFSVEQLVKYIRVNRRPQKIRWETVASLVDRSFPSKQGHSWTREIIQQVSHFIALYYQYPKQFDAQGEGGEHLYQSWLRTIVQDKSIGALMGAKVTGSFHSLPSNISTLLDFLRSRWNYILVSQDGVRAFMQASLHQLSGWASWQAWLDWQADLRSRKMSVSHSLGLLAILLAWDEMIMQWARRRWSKSKLNIFKIIKGQSNNVSRSYDLARQYLKPLWVWQRALEISVVSQWTEQISTISPTELSSERPHLQAVFCIDIRSEPIRRALELQGPGIETVGFAGFFGVPVSYQNYDKTVFRPQLPGMLASSLVAQQQAQTRTSHFFQVVRLGWDLSMEKPYSNIGMIEAGGMLKIVSLFQRVILQQCTHNPIDRDLSRTKELVLKNGCGTPLSCVEKADLGAEVLKAMGIVGRLAKVVLLTGHGSQTCNNPNSSSLNCGACGGQTGEVNVRVLAKILNDQEVRHHMSARGVAIPHDTQFYAALHNTTTDDVVTFEAPAKADWKCWLNRASNQARKKRAKSFGFTKVKETKKVRVFFRRRARDWAQMSPEWGLCNNACAIIAPRHLTRDIDFESRAFLHDYDVTKDSQFTQLEKIMTAPVVVMSWINLHYYASVTAPDKYGSGNKLLHNVVGENIGVFEGNGGDLRMGLPRQSVHDGKEYRHQPLRLSVLIKAPKQAILKIIKKNQDLSSLVNNHWLHLYQISQRNQLWQHSGGDEWSRITVF